MNVSSSTLTTEEMQKVIDFLNLLYLGQSGMNELRSFSPSSKALIKFIPIGQTEKIFDHVDNNPSYNHFFGVASRKDDLNGKKENCDKLGAFFTDIDYGETGHKKKSYFSTREDALSHFNRFPIKPSVIVDSGYGFHLYWLLIQPIDLTQENIPTIEKIMKNLSVMLGGDSTHDISRVLRIPYTLNMKCENPVKSYILSADNNNRYTTEDFEAFFKEKQISQIIKTLQSRSKIRDGVFGLSDEPIIDRSAYDQKILTRLTSEGLTEEVITTIFNLFPTTGKYLERKEKDTNGAEQYLLHSINKSETFIMDQNMSSNKEAGRITKITGMLENLSSNNTTLSSPTRVQIFRAGQNSAEGNTALKLFPINDTEADSSAKPKRAQRTRKVSGFVRKDDWDNVGYYFKSKDSEDEVRLSNFLIIIGKQISSIIDHLPTTKLEGFVKLSDCKEIKFANLEASTLGNPQQLKEFLHNLCGVEVAFYGSERFLCEAIKFFNQNTQKERALEFGYNDELTEYVTSEFIINKDKITPKSTPILNSEHLNNNFLGFKNECALSEDELRKVIIDKLLAWDDPKVTLLGFAFTMLPIVFPFLRKHVKGKPYLTYLGPSGCGKTTIVRLLQQFYGEIYPLFTWTSTPTSVQVKGNAFKDALFVVDDFKRQNFANENTINKVMGILQNYSDESSRSRSNINLGIRDEKIIKGILINSAEDLVITESSTIARGIVVDMERKEIKMREVQEMDELSKSFSFFTINFIKHILHISESRDLKSLFNKNVDLVHGDVAFANLDGDNLPRLINNFALVKTAWDLAAEFLFAGRDSNEYQEKFESALFDVLISNFKRIQDHKPEDKFEETLWTLIEQGVIEARNTRIQYPYDSSKAVVYFHERENDSPTIGIMFKHAYKMVNDYLREEGGIGVQEKTLITKLKQLGKISQPDGGRITVGSKAPFRGFYWTGEIPYDTLGLRKPDTTDSDLPF